MKKRFKEIKYILDSMLNKETLISFLGTPSQKEIDNIYNHWETIESTWFNFPETKFGNLICYLRLIPNLEMENKIWNLDEVEWLNKYNEKIKNISH